MNARELAVLCSQMATMIRAGIPLLQCLRILIKQNENRTLEKALGQIYEGLANGRSIGDTLQDHPKVFPLLFVNMVKSGEISGTLEEVFYQLGTILQKEWELTAKVKSAMLYPMTIVLIALVSVLALLMFAVPQFVMIFNSMAVPLPLTTRTLLWVSGVIRDYWYFVLFCGAAIALIATRLLTSEKGRRLMDKLLLRIPLLGKLLHKMIILRFCRSLSAMLQAGVPILRALEVVRAIMGNYMVMESIRLAENSVREGDGLAQPLENSGLFPPLVVKMIAVGEETGAVDKLLEQVAGFYEQEAGETATRLTALVEPVLIAAVGGLVAFIVLSIMLPVFTIVNYIE